MMIESYMSVLEFYRNIDKNINNIEIEVINKIEKNLKLDKDFEMRNKIELSDCYFQLEKEEKARELIFNFIQNNPDEDEAYQCVQNWYMYDKPDINKLAEVIDLAEKNKHILITDFGYDRLVEFYDSIGDIKNKEKYQELYNKWKENRETLKFQGIYGHINYTRGMLLGAMSERYDPIIEFTAFEDFIGFDRNGKKR